MQLSVNLNKVALLRNSRGGTNPSPLVAARTALEAGAYGITLHWREDNRHTLQSDVRDIRALCKEHGCEFNLEGDLREELIALACEIVPEQVTLVPVTPGEITSDHGWSLPEDAAHVAPAVQRLKAAGSRVSAFVDPGAARLDSLVSVGVDRIEIYTEPYAAAFGTPQEDAALLEVKRTAEEAARLGLGVNAGHDLDLRNLPRLAREVPQIVEVSIGHALVADALYLGLTETVRRYLEATRGEAPEAPCTA